MPSKMHSGIYAACPKGHIIGEDDPNWCSKCNDYFENGLDICLLLKKDLNTSRGDVIIDMAKRRGIPVYSLWHYVRGQKVVLVPVGLIAPTREEDKRLRLEQLPSKNIIMGTPNQEKMMKRSTRPDFIFFDEEQTSPPKKPSKWWQFWRK